MLLPCVHVQERTLSVSAPSRRKRFSWRRKSATAELCQSMLRPARDRFSRRATTDSWRGAAAGGGLDTAGACGDAWAAGVPSGPSDSEASWLLTSTSPAPCLSC